ncbi:alanine racemase [Thermoanaerobacter kivui]|uniref:alanine racemase n=1 Tax=Thermoanaerobacter kivui TaxID=2325 RepID=UPI0006717EF6|nr:alanine racemase [Thermoanaerobacter kivui]
MFDEIRPTRAEIYLDNIVNNLNEVKRLIGNKVKIMGVVKANAYGHGACQVAKVLIENGVSYLAVATVDEALELRDCGIKSPILIFDYTPLTQAKDLIEYHITQTVFDIKYVRELGKMALNKGKKAKVHVKIDTGMGRIGYTDLEIAQREIEEMANMKGIELEGIFSHFSTSDEKDKTYSEMQFDMFKKLLEKLKERKIDIPLKHIANSGAILDIEYSYLDMVRPGIILYGSYPSEEVQKRANLKQTMSFKTKVVYVKEVPEGSYISYGRTFVTKRKSKIATLPVGYADGFNRLLSNNHHVLIKGKYAPVVGRICMDQCMIDVTDVDNVEVGDEVVIFGMQQDKKITVDEIAKKLNTIPYEVYCGISRRVPRIYIYKGEVLEVKNYLKI